MNRNHFAPNSCLPYGINVIDSVDVLDIMFLMKVLFEKAKQIKYKAIDERPYWRGFLTILDGRTGELILSIPYGDIWHATHDMQEKYFEVSIEKAKRLFSYSDKHSTSMESRDPHWNKFGGAIRCELNRRENAHAPEIDIIISFSGMSELCDEAMVLVLGKLIAWLFNTTMLATDADERNPYWKDLYTTLCLDSRIRNMKV